MMDDATDIAIAARLKAARISSAMTIDVLAGASGVSRAMISRIERGQASPTAALLARLCSALGLSLSSFFAENDAPGSPLSRQSDQPVWRDPATGYLRRAVSPAGMPSQVDIVEVEFPPGAQVSFPPQAAARGERQHVWLFEGLLDMQLGDSVHRLSPGDCLFMALGEGHVFHNPGSQPARYAVIFERRLRPVHDKELS